MQSNANTTSFLASPSAINQVLISNGSFTPYWGTIPGTKNLLGVITQGKCIVYQSDVNTTAMLNPPTGFPSASSLVYNGNTNNVEWRDNSTNTFTTAAITEVLNTSITAIASSYSVDYSQAGIIEHIIYIFI